MTLKGSTELYCLFIAADSIVDAISFIRRIVLWSQNKFSPNPVPVSPAGFKFLNPARSGSGQIWNNQIRYNPSIYIIFSYALQIHSVYSERFVELLNSERNAVIFTQVAYIIGAIMCDLF